MCTRYVFTDPADMIRDVFAVTDPLPGSNFAPNSKNGVRVKFA